MNTVPAGTVRSVSLQAPGLSAQAVAEPSQTSCGGLGRLGYDRPEDSFGVHRSHLGVTVRIVALAPSAISCPVSRPRR
ncbi:hypothetical protein GCM10010345_69470 [Streptomyces canarius]|uniref:Uncharacterized protein n=1 Tax=Streptomyces canarius TaxID=285453 RepID=A0ABQ3D519_9ACTN|nr:hypothetical protein GCM10010345_69470 [Streptomyces canarius]